MASDGAPYPHSGEQPPAFGFGQAGGPNFGGGQMDFNGGPPNFGGLDFGGGASMQPMQPMQPMPMQPMPPAGQMLYMQPPEQPFGQPYGQGFAPPGGQQPLLTEDEMQLQAKDQKRAEKEAKRQRRRDEQLSRGLSAVQYLGGFAMLNALLLLVPLFGTSWNSKQIVGFGVRSLMIRSDVFMLSVELDCNKNNFVEGYLCKRLTFMSGRMTLHSALMNSCAISKQACSVMELLFAGSIVLFGCLTLGFCLLVVGTFCLLSYWYSEPNSQVRGVAKACYFLAPLTVTGGVGLWTMLAPDLDEIPRAFMFGNSMNGIAGSAFSMKEAHEFQYGWTFALALLVCISLWIQAVLWSFWFVEHPGEEEAMKDEDDRIIALQSEYLTAQEDGRPMLLSNPTPPGYYGAPGMAANTIAQQYQQY